MKIINGCVDWMEGWGNRPTIRIAVDKMPDRGGFRYERRKSLYYAELDGLVSFFSCSRPGEGFEGRRFTLTMKDGSEQTLIGPWSSRAGAMNANGLGPCVDVSICEGGSCFDRRSSRGGAVTLKLLRSAIDLIDPGDAYRDRSPMTNEIREGGYRQDFSGGRFEIAKIVEDGRGRRKVGSWDDSGEQAHAFRLSSCGDVRYEPAVRLPDGSLWVKPGLRNHQKVMELD